MKLKHIILAGSLLLLGATAQASDIDLTQLQKLNTVFDSPDLIASAYTVTYSFSPNTVIQSAQVNTEFSNISTSVTDNATRITSLESGSMTITGNKTFSGNNTFSGSNTFSGVTTFSNASGVTTDKITEKTASNGVSFAGATSLIKVDNISESTAANGVHIKGSPTNQLYVDNIAAQSGSTVTVAGVTMNSSAITNWLPKNYINGCKVTYNSANQVIINTPCTFTDKNGNNLYSLSGNLTVDMAVTGANGLQSGQSDSASTWYYLYLCNGTSGNAGMLSNNNDNGGSAPTCPANYNTNYRQLPIAMRNDGSANFINFYVSEGWPNVPKIVYRVSIGYGSSGNNQVLSAGSATIYTTVDLSSYVPPISKIASLLASNNAAAGAAAYDALFRTNGGGQEIGMRGISSVSEYPQLLFNLETDASQVIQYKVTNANLNANLYVSGYTVTGF